ncbi:MAG: enoyl-CoA hydratase/isomerase family protein [Gemmatimonadota bacterium]
MTASKRVLYEVAEGVATITLNRPEKRNALDDQTIAELKDCFARTNDEAAVKVVLLRGAGADFCAGADLSQLEKIAAGGTQEENRADAIQLGELLIQMRGLRKPVIAAVHGNALAGGAGLATACDLVIADEHARFGYPEVKLGFVPAMVMALLVRIVGEKVAFELTAFGEPIGAADAQRLGLVNRVVSGNFDQAATVYAVELARRSGSAVRFIKELLHDIDGMSFEDAIGRGADINAAARATDDCRDGVRRFLEARRKS